MSDRPTLLDVFKAKRRINPYVTRTPLHHYPALDRLIGAQVHVKHENYQILGSFKVRGALNVVSQFSAEERRRGVVVATTGNFGQGITYAASVYGVKANVVAPVDANPGKVEAMRQLGANLIFRGDDFDEARQHAEMLADEDGYRYIHSANEPGLVPGVGTYSLEIFEDLPDVDVIIVPVGGGSGVCGACVVSKGINPEVQVIGVQAESAPAAYLSWKKGVTVEAPMDTVAEGLGTGHGYDGTQPIIRDLLDDFVLVSEEELQSAIVLHLKHTHDLTEHAGAAALAAAVKIKNHLKGKKVALIISGGNISVEHLKQALM